MTLPAVWFWLVAAMISAYAALDGFDIGAGVIHFFVGRSSAERAQVLRTIGPLWDGNKVWLIAAGGTLFFAFPVLYASSFSGFYLPLMIVVWLLILRGVSIEFRNHVESPVWVPVWDAGFAISSVLLAIFFGAALGNVIRGVPLDGSGDFFLPLWTNFAPGPRPGILDWYTMLIGVLALCALAVHGARWVAYKTEGALNARSSRLASAAGWVLGILTLAATAASFWIQPRIAANFRHHPWGWVFPIAAVAGWAGINVCRAERSAFFASCIYLAGMLSSAAFGLFPYLLPSNTSSELGLTVYNASPGAYSLAIGLAWWIPGIALVVLYSAVVYRKFAGKVS